MRPAPFDLVAPSSLDEALEAIRDRDDARALAGGQSLIALMNLRLAVPTSLIDLGQVTELAVVEDRDGFVRIGAMATQAQVQRHPVVMSRTPLVAEALGHVGHWQIRSRGTIGGNLAHADPASELPAVMLALDSVYQARSADGSRSIPAGEFNLGPYSTALAEDELLVAVDVPHAGPDEATAIVEVARVAGAYAMAGAAVWCRLDGNTATACRIALFAAGSRAVRAGEAEAAVLGTDLDDDAIATAADAATSGITAHDDLHATAGQRRHLLSVVVQRALRVVRERAGGPAR